ncbi:hypothetical protein FZEAL_8946 [Fusarium zealandicum]|uniref:RING-type domain-containing protein n=1 Tax=Fusarium zealandicum TaxID=1053134 RepID=A0A8H4UDC5_9HYPO|nr:hypothetical protein FZEAL_8946 [Fusarium zealandicum]
MEPVGIILLVLFLFVLIMGPVTCVKLSTRKEGKRVYDLEPDQLDKALRKLSTVTTRSATAQRASPSEDVDIEAQAPLPESDECPICIGPLVPEPAHTVDQDPRPTLDAVSTVTIKKQPISQEIKVCEASNVEQQPSGNAEDDDIMTLNSCGHSFHSKCLSSWFLIERHDCPVCRVPYYKGAQRRERTLPVSPYF